MSKRFGATTYLGTGIEQGDIFAVLFTWPQSKSYGLILLCKDKKPGTGRAVGARLAAADQEVWGK